MKEVKEAPKEGQFVVIWELCDYCYGLHKAYGDILETEEEVTEWLSCTA